MKRRMTTMTKRRIIWKKEPAKLLGWYHVQYWDESTKKWWLEECFQTKWGAKRFLGKVANLPPNYKEERVIQ